MKLVLIKYYCSFENFEIGTMPRNSFVLFSFLLFLPWGIGAQIPESSVRDKHVWLTDRYIAEVGFFATSKSVLIKVDGKLPNNPIDFGETLGLSRYGNTADLSFTWRFSKEKNWFTSLSYFAIRNDQTAVLEDEIRWSNAIYPVGVVLDSGFDVDLYRIFFGRVISKGNKHELSGGLGLHTMNINTYVQATGYFDNTDLIIDSEKKNIDVLAPVPNIGMRYLFAPNLRWAFTANLEWFSLSIGDYRGTLWDISPSVYYQLFDHIGLGLSYKYFTAKLDMKRKVWNGSMDLLYEGPLISISGNF
jgi:hypothetical protein